MAKLNRDKLISEFAIKDYETALPNYIRAMSYSPGGLGDGRKFAVDVLFPQVLHGKADIWGIDEDAAAMLTGIVKAIKPRVVLETGTNKGRSTRAICEALHANGEGHMWTVDWDDTGFLTTGAIREEEKEYVTQVVGKTPEVFAEEPLRSLEGIELAFLDGDHTADGVRADIEYVDLHRSKCCLVLVDNAVDSSYLELRDYLASYKKHAHFPMPTMAGMEFIMMRG